MDSKQITNAVIALAGIGLGYSILKAFSNSAESGITVDQINVDNLTYPLANYDLLADAIESAIWSGFFIEEEAAVVAVLIQMMNIDDVYYLIYRYGRRGSFFHSKDNLIRTVQQYLSESDIDYVNQDYEAKQIPFQWLTQ
jgi:hypothetical protein